MSSDESTKFITENHTTETIDENKKRIDKTKFRAVIRAFIANVGIALVKLICFMFSKSSAMLAEAIHSGVDSFNSICLLVGIKRGSRPADSQHPFGYGLEANIWAMFASLLNMSLLTESAAVSGGTGGILMILYMVVIFGLFYFLAIRPQRNEQKRVQAMLSQMEVGDVVVPGAPPTGLAVLAGTNVAMRVVVSPVNAASLFETDWEAARRKSNGSYHEWVRLGTDEAGIRFSCPFPTGGVFKVHALAKLSAGSREAIYRRGAMGAFDPEGLEPENHIGVASTQEKLDLREFSVGMLGNTAFAKAASLPAQNGFSSVAPQKWKCNAFVAYCAIAVGQNIPVQHGQWPISAYPPLANEWATGTTIAGWTFLGVGVDPEPGWICGFPRPGDSGHSGIVDYDGYCIAAGELNVNRRFKRFLSSRCGYSKYGVSP